MIDDFDMLLLCLLTLAMILLTTLARTEGL